MSPTTVLLRFYEAERRYMKAGGKAGGANFDEFAATMSEKVELHQTPDLPWGGEYLGLERYADWAAHMSSVFSMVDVQDAEMVEMGNKVVIMCNLVTESMQTKEIMRRPMVQIVTVEDGKIVDFRPFYWHVPDYVAAAEGRLSSTA
ncbi:uncharacterized protein A1O9_06385 [Exophiala aquamarina CBS 119918]|uniref:SnoaL-like domain-containing protein n=1 Tax=Exophiala aquamarina CBS 119918 TaxID=1182545 RepID=A0A072PED3_9EURO|nr:uncharacterized protein A1O9_06385 [Exophiala aquamarina CBS 119918]KEF58459.1 hypothetical protein A1O9_06385 [Exophiala aquamarina CBS 119918]